MRWFLALFLLLPLGEALGCSVCFGAPESETTKNMAIAIWFLLGAVMLVLGGVGAFGVYLWRAARRPLAPHEQLVQEDLAKYV